MPPCAVTAIDHFIYLKLNNLTVNRGSTKITPAGAVSQIENHRTNVSNEFDGTGSYDLLCQEELISSRLSFLERMGLPSFSQDASKLKSLRNEIKARRGAADVWRATQLEWVRRNAIWTYFPDDGPLRRELYPRHMEFCAASKYYRRVFFISGNKCGKSLTGAISVVYHATGIYPHWWEGKRFDHPVLCWIANKSGKETRDINERVLLGPPGDLENRGTGLLPSHRIISTNQKPGIPNGCEFIHVRHVSGGTSMIQSKSFDAGREAFQGAPEVHVIWLDEECPMPIAEECAMRTMTCGGILLFTFTPVLGMTDLTIDAFDKAGIDMGALALSAQDNDPDEYDEEAVMA